MAPFQAGLEFLSLELLQANII